MVRKITFVMLWCALAVLLTACFDTDNDKIPVTTTATEIVSVTAPDSTTVLITFNKAMENAAGNKDNYEITSEKDGQISRLTVTDAALSADSKQVTLTTENQTAVQFTVKIINVFSEEDNKLIDSSKNNTFVGRAASTTPPTSEPPTSEPPASNPEPNPAPAENKADYAAFNTSLPKWDVFSKPVPSTSPTKLTGAPVGNVPASQNETIGAKQYACTTTPYSLTKTPNKIVTFDPDAGILYPGSLIQGKGHLLGIGSLKELPIRQRAPIALSINLLNNDNTKVVQNPDGASIQSAIGELIAEAHAAGHVGGSKATYTEKTTHSVQQAALELGFSARYMSGSVEGSLAASRSLDKTTITASFVQNLYTVSIVTPQTPSDWFSNAFSQEILDQQVALGNIGSDNVPVYVANVVYGRILNFSFTSTASEDKIRAALSAAYEGGVAGGSGSISAELSNVLNTAEIKIAQVGGSSSQVENLIRAGNIKAYFEGDTELTSAVPISYTLRNVGDNSIASVAETTKYNITTCTVTDVEKKIIGERLKITLQRVQIIEGQGNDDLYGEFVLNGKVYSFGEQNINDDASKQLDLTLTKTFMYGSSDKIEITGFVKENDGVLGDDDVGEWGIRYSPVFTASGAAGVGKPFVGQNYTVPLYAENEDVSHPEGRSILFWKIEKIKDVREGDPIEPVIHMGTLN